MTRLAHRLLLLAGVLPALAVAVVGIFRPTFLDRLDHAVYDAIMRASPTAPPNRRIVIVDVDESSLSAIGQWPWRRDIVGRLVTRLRDLGASVIALDMIFAEADRSDGSAPSTDVAFAEALRPGRVVVGYALTFDPGRKPASACLQHPLGLAVIRNDEEQGEEAFFRATGAICSLPSLTQAAEGSGFLNAAPDLDGRLRRVPLLIDLDGRVYPALAVAAFAADRHPRDVALRVANLNTSSLLMDGLTVPLDGKSNLLLRYRGKKRTFPYVSAADVLSGRAQAETFANSIVFVGTTALGTREVVATPVDTLFAGVEVQATITDNLLQGDFIRRPEHATAIEAQAAIGLGIAAALLVARLGIVWGSLGVVAAIAATWGGAVWTFSAAGAYFSPLFPTAGLVAGLIGMTVTSLTIHRRRADRAVEARATSERLMIQSLLSLTEVRDADTGRHSRRTHRYAQVLATQLASHPRFRDYLTPERIELLATLAPLHDIGKVGVPDRLLRKPGPLTGEELAEMRNHPRYGRDVILKAERDVGARDHAVLAMAKEIVYTHHERWDGTGYPEGLRGEQIPIPGRIVALVDAWDSLRSNRVYRRAVPHEEAVRQIASARGTHFDPAVVEAFINVSDVLRAADDVQMESWSADAS
jgi:CHASE2 domain-containing sensor protein